MARWDPIAARCPLRANGFRFEDLVDGHCDHCNERVVNLSQLTEREARALVARGRVSCVAVERDHQGRARFRPSRVAALLVLLGVTDARAADVDVRTGIETSPTPGERVIDFGGVGAREGLLPVESCHPHRWPHGPGGPGWISVGRGLKKVWERVVLECSAEERRLFRERREFPAAGERLQFTELPADTQCELTFRGGEPTETVSVRTPAQPEDPAVRRTESSR
ncbi:MAG: hypothetical protein R3F61_26890 [Myxococcota bacterium]